jgi:hypothetical protein
MLNPSGQAREEQQQQHVRDESIFDIVCRACEVGQF